MEDYLIHYGINGMKWGIRRYQNEDGTLTSEGRERYAKKMTKKVNRLEQRKLKYQAENGEEAFKKTVTMLVGGAVGMTAVTTLIGGPTMAVPAASLYGVTAAGALSVSALCKKGEAIYSRNKNKKISELLSTIPEDYNVTTHPLTYTSLYNGQRIGSANGVEYTIKPKET